MQRTDEELRQAVEKALREESRVDEKEIRVAVEDAVVTLSGCVDSTWEKRIARVTAENVEGVKSVHDHLTVKNFVRRPDHELVEEVRHRLQRDPFVQGRIEVYAHMGEIRLDGEVPTYAARKAAEHVAWFTPGVINVENLLLVTEEEFVDVSPLEVEDA